MKATRTLLVVIAAASAAGCSRTPNPVAPPDGPASFDVVQSTSIPDSVSTELRGVHTFGGGN